MYGEIDMTEDLSRESASRQERGCRSLSADLSDSWSDIEPPHGALFTPGESSGCGFDPFAPDAA